jgi:hypothetical protein
LAFGECGLERKDQRIRYFKLVRVLPQEEHTIIDQPADNESQDFPQITTGDFFFFRGTYARNAQGWQMRAKVM